MKQEIHFITGKGGVGKSAVAAAFALKKSRQGLRTLLVEMGDQSFFQDFFELSQVQFKPQSIKSGLDIALWSGQDCLKEYALHLIKVESLYKIFFENAVTKALINVAPALPELAIMGKITSGPRKHGPPLLYDCLVIDGYATGHFMALMNAAPAMAKAVQFGPMGEQSRSIDKTLRDTEICHYHIVTLPEELPLKESLELQQSLQEQFQINAEILLNKMLKTSLTSESLQKLQNKNADISAFADYVKFQVEHQAEIKNRAQKSAANVYDIPLIFETDPWTIIEKISEVLP